MGRIEAGILGRIFDAQARGLRLYACQWCDPGDAEDVVQEAFVRLSVQAGMPENPAAWLFRVVRNLAVSSSRSGLRRRRRESAASRREAWFDAADERLDADAAAGHLAELEADCREIIVARIWGGLTFEEIAGLQGCSLTTAHRRYREGLSLLHERLERPCVNPTGTN
ncbi:RNA polymerase sigma factor [Aquisphaera insulae]|uniref:RNA polymerase sigma factor n=1 Tax=Aquisphaera insulae TaxID=2712864 RepID=UPI0013EC1192|nr:RNA polymerase sigma factor [Aquisphaera insulae]